MSSLMRFLLEHRRPGSRTIATAETTYRRDGDDLPATVYRPAGSGRLPGWVVLHGLTYTGREHPALIRFVRSVAAAGHLVMVPDIPEWRDLRVAPAVTHDTIAAAVRFLHDRPDVRPDRIGLFGFSFGATQALIAAADERVAALLRAIAAWGGYHDLRRLCVFGMTGMHEIDGTSFRLRPDPYGAWVMGGNYLTRVPGHEHDGDVAAAVHELAREAGRVRAYAWDPVYDPTKVRLRASLPPSKRALFDMLAPPSGAPLDSLELRREIGLQLADAVLRADPLMDPQPYLPSVGTPVLLAHSRDDRLVPFSETLRLARDLAPDRLASCTITAIFDHSGRPNRDLGPAGLAKEAVRFVRVLRGILSLI